MSPRWRKSWPPSVASLPTTRPPSHRPSPLRRSSPRRRHHRFRPRCRRAQPSRHRAPITRPGRRHARQARRCPERRVHRSRASGYPRSDRADGGAASRARGIELPDHRRPARRDLHRPGPTAAGTAAHGGGAAPPEPPRRSSSGRCCRTRRRRPSIPHSTRWRRPCWCRMRARSKTWCAKCSGRCSSPGSTTTCPAIVERLVRAEIERVSRGRG